ncbi:hypothetical protein Hroenn_gp13 [Pelagibacter phage Hroenn EXVC015P]|nr:hypothetical protein Bylgja_gp1 [Pelagibacter phage Bylgja EXVC010P]QLF88297.1 hypothetical protein Himinglaeva_gp1 [Pelagibacter phage Himinglaeva EXVC011P]QLF88358.1 hypothetical protein Hroenn_gp13 [Pelagibacter phage Hroenn EXVC015P]QLF88595.1 hypothetical protein Unn_gp37 [Pelagibacter phage Unn EXVC019P]
MCGGGNPPNNPPVQPVRNSIAGADELSPEIELASEDSLEIAKKKKKKKGTTAMQTDLNIGTSNPSVNV